MSALSCSEAELAKLKGNGLFAVKDYESAVQCYTDAITLDASQPIYPLNRCFANLKLQRWLEAEQDANSVLALDSQNMKALYRRSLARKEQGNFAGARKDMFSFANVGGDMKTVIEENIKIASAEAEAVLRTLDTPACGFRIAPSKIHNMGLFATHSFSRGDLILIEKPLYIVHGETHRDIIDATENLTEEQCSQILELHNSQPNLPPCPIIGIHSTNAFITDSDSGIVTSVLCLRASRINHSCNPNARYSWHAESGTFRVFALRAIAAGEEIFHSYNRKVSSATRAQRQGHFSNFGDFSFGCSCAACSLPKREQRQSDRRREEIGRLLGSLPKLAESQYIEACARGVRLLHEEGLDREAEVFTVNAAIICAYHGDWESVKYWALETYKIRVDEFGGDCYEWTTTPEMKTLLCNPQEYKGAGKVERLVLTTRL